MSEKKVVARATAIGLAVLCIVILMGAVGAVIYYNQTINNQNTAYDTLQSQNSAYVNDHSHTNADWESLKSQLTDAQNQLSTSNSQSTVTNLQNQIDSLQSQLSAANSQLSTANSQINNLKAPNVIKVNMKADDSRPLLGTPNLHVYGELCNVGTNIANNVKVHVVAYQSGGVVAIDTYIVVGSMNGETWTSVNGSPTYGGSALTSWTITPEWT